MPVVRDGRPGHLGLRRDPAAFALGFLACSAQIYILREFAAQFQGNEVTYGFVLSAWLLWGGLGSLAGAKGRIRAGRPGRWFGAALLFLPAALALLRLSRPAVGLLPGELTGMVPPLLLAFGLCLLVGFPLGVLFVINVRLADGDVARVYRLESLGAAAAGLAVHLVLIPFLSNWRGAAVAAGVAAGLMYHALRDRGERRALAAGAALLIGLAAADGPAQRFAWKPFRLDAVSDSPHGRLSVIRSGEQVSLYADGAIVASSMDAAAAEDAVHFALLQRPESRTALLIGGGAPGALVELLKHPLDRIDTVVSDPRLARLVDAHFPEAGRSARRDPRVRSFEEDGRAFLRRSDGGYDLILLDLPAPATARLNRFYTREFFALARARLAPGGVLSFVVPSSEIYISERLGRFLASLHTTLTTAFPEVAAVPGDANVFLGSDAPLTLDPSRLCDELERRGIETTFVSRGFLAARLRPEKVRAWRERVLSAEARLNRDFAPISYYFEAVLWASRFRGAESRALEFLAGIPAGRWLDVPLAAFGLYLAAAALSRRRRPGLPLIPLAVMGLTSIVVEVVVILAFQALFGYVYGAIALLLAAYMGGLFLGAWVWRNRSGAGRRSLAAVLGAFALLILGLRAALEADPGPAVFYVVLAAFGCLGGSLFTISNRLFLRRSDDYGRGYGIDLLGSFAGALAVSAFIIPLAGAERLLEALAAANALTLLFVLIIAPKEA